MSSRQVIIKRIALGPLAQWGFIIGAVVACLPAFLCSWAFFTLVQTLRNLMNNMSDMVIDPNFLKIHINLVDILQLQSQKQNLTQVAGFGVLGIALVALGIAVALGIFGALVTALLGMFYNATGRVQLELEEVPERARKR